MFFKEIIFIAPLPAIRRRVRLAKMTEVILQSCNSIRFLGWERTPGELEKFRWRDQRVKERAILSGGGWTSKKTRMMYPVWMMLVFFHVLILGRRKIIFCLGWETAFPVIIACFLTKSKVIFDDADRFSMLLTMPRFLKNGIERLERWASKHSLVHLIPGWTRYDWRNDNMIALVNTPTTTQLKSVNASGKTHENSSLIVYVNGWLNWDTGSRVFLKALDLSEARQLDMIMIVAGKPVCEEAHNLINHPKVRYFGELPQEQALSLYLVCDVALTYYDPSVAINRHAESNKWGDCIALGRPFIVNNEVSTAKKFVERGAAFSCPYHDANSLVDLFESLINDKSRLLSATKAIRSFENEYPPYDMQLFSILLLIHDMMSVKRR